MKTTAYIREAEAFVTSLTEEYYQNGAGLKDALEIVAIYQRHSRLFERETAAALITDRATRESRYLAHFAASGFVENQLREATERIGTADLTLDVEERPLKSPRAFCAPVRVPQDVRLVIKPRGGHDDYAAILHEAGHSEHFAHVRADAPFAYRYLGDNSITEAYAFLFDGLSRNPRWLRNVMGARETDDYLFLVRFSHLLLLRRYGAKLPYELELHRAPDPSTFGGRYGEGLGDALRLRIWRENFLHDLDDWFYCACYLRAWILEVQLRAALVDRFGDHWFAAKGAGDFLKEIWSLGQELSAEELAQRIGYSGLDASLLITDLLSPIGD